MKPVKHYCFCCPKRERCSDYGQFLECQKKAKEALLDELIAFGKEKKANED